MGRRRKTGDTASKSYRKYPPTDITLAKRSFFIRIRRWYAMQTSRLRRPDAVKSRPLPSLSLIFLSFLFLSFDTQTISIGFQLIWGAHSMGKQGVSCVLCSINPVAGVVLLCLSKSAAFHFSCFDTRCPNRPRFSFWRIFILFYFIFVFCSRKSRWCSGRHGHVALKQTQSLRRVSCQFWLVLFWVLGKFFSLSCFPGRDSAWVIYTKKVPCLEEEKKQNKIKTNAAVWRKGRK